MYMPVFIILAFIGVCADLTSNENHCFWTDTNEEKS
jgi:hypothetical protein